MRAPARHGQVLVGVLLALVGALAACSGLPFSGDAATPRPTSSTDRAAVQSPPATTTGLEAYYRQKLTWTACRSFQCAKLTVPLDYAEPTGATVSLAVLKAPARSSSSRIGSLVVNPGGPGGSGVQYAASADLIVSAPVRRSYDIVGFDPRGVGQSEPVECLGDRGVDALLGSDPTPDDATERAVLLAGAQAFADACKENAGPLLAHVSTVEVAKDMDVLRAALGETRLDYLGKSYGTFLGATYADLFPGRVGRFVLDGAIAPDLTTAEVNLGQAVGFETATRAYVGDCVREGKCPLGSSVDAGMERLRALLTELDRSPLRIDDPHVKELTEGWASLGIAAAMYDQGSWDALSQALKAALAGDGNILMSLANRYAHRGRDGDYTGNLMQVIYAVNCLDRAETDDPDGFQREADRFARSAPTWGRFLAWGSAPCAVWPVEATNAPKKVSASGSGPIVVVGTTRDPATPYAWAERLAGQLQDGHLVTFAGDGHTAYMRSNSCVDHAVDAYLLRGTVPAGGLRC